MEYTLVDLWNGRRRRLEFVLDIVCKPRGQIGFSVLPWRWIVERTFAWLGNYPSPRSGLRDQSTHERGLDQNRHDPPYGAKARLSILRQLLSDILEKLGLQWLTRAPFTIPAQQGRKSTRSVARSREFLGSEFLNPKSSKRSNSQRFQERTEPRRAENEAGADLEEPVITYRWLKSFAGFPYLEGERMFFSSNEHRCRPHQTTQPLASFMRNTRRRSEKPPNCR